MSCRLVDVRAARVADEFRLLARCSAHGTHFEARACRTEWVDTGDELAAAEALANLRDAFDRAYHWPATD